MNATTKKKAAPKKRMAKVTQKEIVVPVSPAEAAMNSMMVALESGTLTPEQMSIVLDNQERIIDKQSKQSYSQAMSRCQGAMPSVGKNKANTQTRSEYADLDAVIKTIKPVYTSHGFGLSFSEEDSPKENHVRVVCDIMHVDGWSEQKHVDVPLDLAGIGGKTNKTMVHGTGSAFSYGRR